MPCTSVQALHRNNNLAILQLPCGLISSWFLFDLVEVVLLLQRVYGITFPDKDSMKAYQHRMEQAKKRDHRLLGTQQELFFFDRLSPGSCFFLPNGARVYNNLIEVCS